MDHDLATKEITTVVVAFYQKAVADVIIGYHFKHIADFSTHIPRIINFWTLQLLGIKTPTEPPLQIIPAHIPLKIKRAEVGRWVLLFEQTLEEHSLHAISQSAWKKKLHHFRQVFLNHPRLF